MAELNGGLNRLWEIFTNKLETNDFSTGGYTMRNLCLRRNVVVFHKKFKTPHFVLEVVKSEPLDYLLAYDFIPQNNLATIRGSVRWSPPGFGKVNLNWDASVYVTTKRMGIVIALRDNMGEVFACLSSS